MKAIWNNFLGGLAPYSDLIGREGSYAEARDVDPHRKPGYIMPGWKETAVSSVDTALAGLILDAAVDPDNATLTIYAIDDGKLYEIGTLGTAFTDDANFPHAVSTGSGVVFYECKIGGTSATRLFYIQDTDVGMSNVGTPDFDDDWLSTIPAGGAALTSGKHPYLKWKSYLWIAHGNDLGKLDGQTGDNGTWTSSALDLPEGWEITSLFSTQNYIGICAWYKLASGSGNRTIARIFMWDGVSADWNYWIPIEDNKVISSLNDGSDIYLLTEGRGYATNLKRLTDRGDELIYNFRIDKGGSDKDFEANYHNVMDISLGRLLMGLTKTNYQNSVFAYGSVNPIFPKIMTQPYSGGSDPDASNAGDVGYVGSLYLNTVFFSSKIGTNYYWGRFPGNESTNALYKGLYKNPEQKVRINYVKFYFKPLVASDDMTPTLDIDYGTSITLKDRRGNATISYAEDGAITSKLFNVKRTCHAFRPVLDWTAGGIAFSKIIVDFDYIND